MPVKETKDTKKSSSKKPVVKRASAEKVSKAKVEVNEDSASESEHEQEVEAEAEAEVEVEVIASKKTSAKSLSKQVVQKEEVKVSSKWEDQSDEGFDGDEPVQTQTVASYSQPQHQPQPQSTHNQTGGFARSHSNQKHDECDERDEGDNRTNQRKPTGAGARYGSFASSPALNFDYKMYSEVEQPVNELTTKDLIKICIVRSYNDKQLQLCRSLKQLLRAMNLECEFPGASEMNLERTGPSNGFSGSSGGGYKGKNPNPKYGNSTGNNSSTNNNSTSNNNTGGRRDSGSWKSGNN